MSDLSHKHCKPCKGDDKPLSKEQVNVLLNDISQWKSNEQSSQITRTFKFKNYYETIAFVNAIAWISHQEDHHPDLQVEYNKCTVNYSTHTVKGLSENDFICAAKINNLVPE